MRHTAVITLCLALIVLPATAQEPAPTLKERVLEIKPETMVQVQLKTKEKIRGRIHSIQDAGFSLRVARADRIEDRAVTFGELKSVKSLENGSHTGRNVAIGVLAGAGAAILTIFLIFVSIAD